MKRTVSAAVRNRRNLIGLLLTTVSTAAPIAAAAAQQPVQLPPLVSHAVGTNASIRGLIVARRGDQMYVKADGAIHVVTLTDNTSIVAPSGFMKVDKKHYDASVLIPGLGVTVDGSGNADGTMLASRVKFAKEALKVAQQIDAGGEVVRSDVEKLKSKTTELDARTDKNEAAIKAANDSIMAATRRANDSLRAVADRIGRLDDYGVKLEARVNFKTGSSQLSTDSKRILDQLVANGTGLSGYMVQVAGYTDAVGPDRNNRRLAERRADAVVDYLIQEKKVPARRILNPTGFGEANAIATNKTATGRAQNRRVEVQVLVNSGIRGGTPANP
jgi:outer membrane protein OmpA-like peptidoglycan-associated protein